MWNLITEDTTKYMIWSKWDTMDETLKNIKDTQEKAKDWKEWQSAVYEKNTWELIWRCWINKYNDEVPSCELGYWISENYYGKWIIPECVNRFLYYAFKESEFEKVVIRCDSQNQNSQKVALKCGFKQEWKFLNHERIKWQLRDTIYFGITKEQYLSQ